MSDTCLSKFQESTLINIEDFAKWIMLFLIEVITGYVFTKLSHVVIDMYIQQSQPSHWMYFFYFLFFWCGIFIRAFLYVSLHLDPKEFHAYQFLLCVWMWQFHCRPSLFSYKIEFYFFFLGQGHYHMPETRGLCLSEEQTISTVRICSKASSCLFTEIYGALSEHLFVVSYLSYFDLNITRF